MELYIKNMVSNCCKLQVAQHLEATGIPFTNIEIGRVETRKEVSVSQLADLNKRLLTSGLALIDNKKSILVERIKNAVVESIYENPESQRRIKYSEYISQKVGKDYAYLANMFSERKGITLQQYIILQRIERAKALLIEDGLSLTEISYRLNYSSVAHLSAQFKKVTGLSPSLFMKNGGQDMKRNNIEEL